MMNSIRFSSRFFSLSLLAAAVALLGGKAHATTYYWDCTSPIEAAGFGTAGGTWRTDLLWSTSSAGTITPGIKSPTTGDDLNFGYTATGLAAGTVTVTVTGIQNAGTLTFASGSGAIVLSGGMITLPDTSTITLDNAADTISSVITGAGTSLTKAGTGNLTLSGANTYSGPTTISAGTLTIGGAGKLGSGTYAANIVNNGALNYASTSKQTLGGVISGTGSLTHSGGYVANLTLAAPNTYTGGTMINGAQLCVVTVAANNALGSGPVTIGNGTVSGVGGIRLNNGTSISNNIVINAGSGVAGWGIITLVSGTATNAGSVTINAAQTGGGGGHFAGSSPGFAGTLYLSGTITSSVPVTVRFGTVVFAGGGSSTNLIASYPTQVGATDGIATNAVVAMTSTLDLKGYSQTLAGIYNI